MPPASRTASSTLAISLAAPPNWSFAAGDTIIGSVARQLPLVAPEATVTIRLLGRAKVKITVSRGNNRHDVYRSRVNFFTAAPSETQRVVFHGPVHIPQGGDAQSWPFSLAIPTSPMIANLQGLSRECSFLPLSPEEVANHPLPGTFSSSDHGLSTRSECYVEYYLEATMRFAHKGSISVMTATQPVLMRHPSTSLPITDFRLMQKPWPRSVRSYRLIPGQETADLSFKQKSQKFFGSSKVPQFNFKLHVWVPGVLQLDNPMPVPIRLLVEPLPQQTSADIADAVHAVTLNHIKVTVKSDTRVLAPGNWSGSPHDDYHRSSTNLGMETLFARLQEAIKIPSAPGDVPIDIGLLLQLRLTSRGLCTADTLLATAQYLRADFTTYSIRHTNSWKWSISYTIAGDKQKLEFEVPLAILPPPDGRQIEQPEQADQRIAPPAYAPPPFEAIPASDVKKVDAEQIEKKEDVKNAET
ncbi:catabolite repression protein CAT5 [Purpureocillium lavendulum]|uniref:Catabolite repression protein CAT5 n=1 Tax=Purpureocillium lavendulum TaxID=1247861 RepID=A0AB34FN64_9HYPO|nr:catabolite repression protein CAT5 [Purpureocillium lavendulum]